MSTENLWNVVYLAGASGAKLEDGRNPMDRATAIEALRGLEQMGWRGWAENAQTGKRLAETEAERRHHQKASALASIGALVGAINTQED